MNQFNLFFLSNVLVFIPLLIWSLFWKGCALWIAAKEDKKIWFWIILILNTVGIVEIIYIFFVAKKGWQDIKGIFVR